MQILYSDPELLAVNKPAGMPSQPDQSGDTALADSLRQQLKLGKEDFLGLLHRLDRPTSGIVLIGLSSSFAAAMSALFRSRALDKTYLALCEMVAEPGSGQQLDQFMAPTSGGMRVYRKAKPDAKPARLSYQTVATTRSPARCLLKVNLETGVKHQIRAQLAFAGLPVVGDFRYGPFARPARPERVADGRAILLHAAWLSFTRPGDGEKIAIAAPLPTHWQPYLATLPQPMRRGLANDPGMQL
ncbi:MAG: RNA pseudouridine synthase [Planctomycetes bacterium]|nr:RNA pseudouridine synthase [Planctomycetota bacterium]